MLSSRVSRLTVAAAGTVVAGVGLLTTAVPALAGGVAFPGVTPASAEDGRLDAGQRLDAGDVLVSPAESFGLLVQGDGNVVVYDAVGTPQWATGTAGHPDAFLTLQTDGNLVVYAAGGQALWANGVSSTDPGAQLIVQMQDDGNLVEYSGSTPLWSSKSGIIAPPTGGNTGAGGLGPTDFLPSGGYLQSGRYTLVMQTDGNLVEYLDGTRGIWSSRTAGRPGAYLVMQQDGNAVVYQGGIARFSTRTSGNAGASLRLQTDGNVVVYSSSRAVLFATGVGPVR